jgi:F-type H+-transporting ATPase subunit delta
MLKGAIARRYAEAVFDIAQRQNTIERTLDDVKGIAEVFSNRTLSYLLREPKISVKRKETAIRQALADKVLPTSLNLALLLVQRELVEVTPRLATELENLVLDYRNEAVAQVTTAAQIDEAMSAIVKKALEKRTGRKIIMETRTDPSILGGVIARVGDEIIDGSVRTRLHILKQQLLSGVANSSSETSSESIAQV